MLATKFYQKMTLDTGLLSKAGHFSDRGRDLLHKRNSQESRGLLASENLSLDFKKKILKQQLLDHEKLIARMSSSN